MGKLITTTNPTGMILKFAGGTTPPGFILCDGTAISRVLFSGLFAVIGTTYGAGNGTTTFNVPDMRGRSPVGAGTGSGLTNRILGTQYGEENHTLSIGEMPSHGHSISDPGHTHNSQGNFTPVPGGSGSAIGFPGAFGLVTTNNATGISVNANGSGTPHNVLHPVLAVNFVIKY